MADTFGQRIDGRAYEGEKFYSIPSENIEANSIFCPLATSGQFGVAEIPVASGALGAFSKRGTFVFAKPDGWTSVNGQPVYYTPTTQGTGAFTTSKGAGTIFVGFEVVVPGISATQIYIDIQPAWDVKGAGVGNGTGTTNAEQTAITHLTDSSSGTASNAIAAPAGEDFTAAELQDNFASLAAKVNAILTALEGADILA